MIKNLVICVTNDLDYDQRLLKTCQSLSAALGIKITCIGVHRNKKSIYKPNKVFQAIRFKLLFDNGPLFYLEYNLRLLIFLLTHGKKFDAITAFDADTLLASSIAKKVLKKPLFYDAHEWFTEVPELQGRTLIKRIWTSIESFGVNNALKCYTVGPIIAEKLGSNYGKEFEVVRNLPIFNQLAMEGKKENVVIYQGALNKGRCLDVFVDLAKLMPSYHFVMVGSGDLDGEIKQRLDTENLANIELTGRVLPEDLKLLTAKARYGFNMLENVGQSYYYSLANKFFDYAAEGVISINSDFPEYRILHDRYHHALLAKPTASDIRNVIEGLSAVTIEAMVNSGYKMLRENNWQLESQNLVKIYSEVH